MRFSKLFNKISLKLKQKKAKQFILKCKNCGNHIGILDCSVFLTYDTYPPRVSGINYYQSKFNIFCSDFCRIKYNNKKASKK